MFKYGNTGNNSQPREKENRVVTRHRLVTYINTHPKTGKDVISQGWEIAQELAIEPGTEAPTNIPVGFKTVENLNFELKNRKKNDRVKKDDETRS